MALRLPHALFWIACAVVACLVAHDPRAVPPGLVAGILTADSGLRGVITTNELRHMCSSAGVSSIHYAGSSI